MTPSSVADLASRALAKSAEMDWQLCFSAAPARFYCLHHREETEIWAVWRPLTAQECVAWGFDRSPLIGVCTAQEISSSGAHVRERYLVELPLWMRAPVTSGEVLWCIDRLPEGKYLELTDDTIHALRSCASQGGAA